MSSPLVLSRLAAPVLAAALLGCGGDDLVLPSRTEPQVEAVHGDEQVAPPGTMVPEPLIVRLVDPAGSGIPGRTVVWVVEAGGGTIEPASPTTDGEGFASARWTLGPAAGPNLVRAEVPEVGEVTFTALASTDGGGPADTPSASNSTIAADPSSIPAVTGTSTITVTVRDQDGNPLPGATVTLQASGSGNTLTQPSGTTGSNGVAVGMLQAATPGTTEVSARVNGFLTLNQTASVTVTSAPPTTADRLEVIEGNGQIAQAGAQVPIPPAVRVLDAAGAPVAGVEVSFAVTGGGGSVVGGAQTTDEAGAARVGGWRLGALPGTNTLEVRAASLDPVVFTAEGTSTVDAVERLTFLEQPPLTLKKNETFNVRVALLDASGNLVAISGIVVYLGLFPDGDQFPSNDLLQGERFVSTVDGVAEFQLRVTERDRYRLRALTDDLPRFGSGGPEPFLFSHLFEVD